MNRVAGMASEPLSRREAGKAERRRLIIQAARDRHVREINGDVLAANPGMTRFAEDLGFDIRPGYEPEVRKLVLRL